MSADKARDDAAAIDVAGQHDRHIGGCGKSHVRDIAFAQIDFSGTARAFDQHDVGVARQIFKTLEYSRQQRRFLLEIVLRAQRSNALAA